MTEGYMGKLIRYIKKNLSKGYTLESLKWALIEQGYSRSEVDRAIKLVHEELAKNAPKLKDKPKITVTRESIYPAIPIEEKKGFWIKIKEIFS